MGELSKLLAMVHVSLRDKKALTCLLFTSLSCPFFLPMGVNRIMEVLSVESGMILLTAYSGPSPWGDDLSQGNAGAILFGAVTADLYPVEAKKHFPTGVWTHMAFTFDASARLGTVYSNGK